MTMMPTFTPEQARYLQFLRWLYRRGILTEWPQSLGGYGYTAGVVKEQMR